MAKLLAAPTKNAVQKTLAAQLLNTASTGDPITFDDVDGIPNLPGVLVINRVNTSGTATPSSREYIEYSGTSGSTVLITTRNVDGSNAALTHAVGSIVEFIPDVTWADRIYDALATLVDTNDISAINSAIVTLTGAQTLTNKVINGATFASLSLNIPSSATGDMFYRSSGGVIARLPLGSTNQVLTANASLPFWSSTSTPAGSPVQTVHTQTGAVATGTTTLPFDDSIPQSGEGIEFMTLAITPTSATNKLIIDVVANISHTGTDYLIAALFQDSTADALAAIAEYASTGTTLRPMSFRYEMTAGTTSATTFKVRCGSPAAGTLTFNGSSSGRIFGGVMASSIRISEIKV